MWLERAFEKSETFEMLKALNGNKASGPNGFSLAFFQSCLEVLKEDVMNFMLETSLKGDSVTFLLPLLPRKKGQRIYIFSPYQSCGRCL